MKISQSQAASNLGCWFYSIWMLIKISFYYSSVLAFYKASQVENSTGWLLYGVFVVIVFIVNCIRGKKKRAEKKEEERRRQQKVYNEYQTAKMTRDLGAMMYPKILASLPTDNSMETILRDKGIFALTELVRNHANAVQLFTANPTREVLEFIHKYNADCAYQICGKLAKTDLLKK